MTEYHGAHEGDHRVSQFDELCRLAVIEARIDDAYGCLQDAARERAEAAGWIVELEDAMRALRAMVASYLRT